MRIYPTFFNIFFKGMDPEKAHHVGFWGVQTLRNVGITRALRKYFQPAPELATTVMGITFPSPFGLAAGFDKGGKGIAALAGIGFGHVEMAVINRMGFNNDGAAAAGPRVAAARADLETEYRGAVRPVIGVNIGKTKVVELENAIEDYLISTRTLAPQADYLVVNVSSPNTPGLRTLQAIESLRPLLAAVREEADRVCPNRHVPLTVKIAPDLVDEDVIEVAALAKELKLDGIIATNTTIAREGLGLTSDMTKVKEIGAGGLSGAPLKPRSLEVLRLLKREIGDDLAIISVGGVTTAKDVQERLDAGADLVQGYTAFLYEGPLWAAHINRGLVKLRRARR